MESIGQERVGKKVLRVIRATAGGVKIWRDMTFSSQLKNAKYKPHQGKRECARRKTRMKGL